MRFTPLCQGYYIRACCSAADSGTLLKQIGSVTTIASVTVNVPIRGCMEEVLQSSAMVRLNS